MADRFLAGNGRTCFECHGDGWTHRPHGTEPCPACDGTGRIALEPAAILAAMISETQTSRAQEAQTL